MKPRLELAFDSTVPAHARAADLAVRPALEEELAGRAGVAEVVIDVPEPISFESDLPILGSGSSFSTYATVFRPEVVAAFARSLRVLRVFSKDDVEGRVAKVALELLSD